MSPPIVLALTAPVDPSSVPPNPAFKWYMHYAETFDADFYAAMKTPTRFVIQKYLDLLA